MSSSPEDNLASMDSIGYAAAMTELDEILRTLDDDQLDIDRLGDLVERAAVLIGACRSRLDAARFRVSGLIDELGDSAD